MIPFELHDHERVIAVVPEQCSGPNWGNQVVWVYIQNTKDQTLRVECLQPQDFTLALFTLFDAGAAMHKALKEAILTTRVRRYEKEAA